MTATAASPSCPKCQGPMFDQKAGKYPWKPGTPIFRCRNKAACDGVIWEPKNGSAPPQQTPTQPAPQFGSIPALDATLDPVIVARHHAAFKQALLLAVEAGNAGVPVDLRGVSALTYQLFGAHR